MQCHLRVTVSCALCDKQAVLMYTEAVLIGQYIWLIPTRLDCSWVTSLLRTQIEEVCASPIRDVRHSIVNCCSDDHVKGCLALGGQFYAVHLLLSAVTVCPSPCPCPQVGLHQTAVRCLPLFVLYLGTLMHTYSLAYLEVCSWTSTLCLPRSYLVFAVWKLTRKLSRDLNDPSAFQQGSLSCRIVHQAGAAAVDSPATHDIESGHKQGASSPGGSGRAAGSAAGAEAPAHGPRRTGSAMLHSAQVTVAARTL